MIKKITEIENIGNYYGSLHVKKTMCKYYMKVFCEVSEKEWREISNTTQIMMGLQPNFDIPDPSFYFELRPGNTLTDAGGGYVLVTLTSGESYTEDMVGKYITIKED